MIRVMAIKDNKTLKYSKGKVYYARISQQCNSILFIENDLSDSIIVNKFDFKIVKKHDVVYDSDNWLETFMDKLDEKFKDNIKR